jgi:tagatose 1,6-diphosphate aldolase GatY/KbaY
MVEKAEKYQANVEAELGYIAKLGQAMDRTGFTHPSEAQRFVAETGVHALAVAIGSAHGFYNEKPQLDLDLLSRIRSATDVCLVLHGASGIPDVDLKEAIRRGICKVNIATETKNIFMKTLKEQIIHTDEIDLRHVFPPAINAVRELIKQKLRLING